jgi:hypothetical protein
VKRLLKVLLVLVVLVVLVVLAGIVVAFSIDGIAKSSIEDGASSALGVKTSVRDMDVAIMGGECKLEGLQVANPQGFRGDHFLTLDTGRVVVSLGSLLEEQVVIPTLYLADIDVKLEMKDGKTNYSVILDNISKSKPEKRPGEGEGKKFVINDTSIRNVSVDLDMVPAGGELTKLMLKIPEIRLKEIGSGSGKGVVISELTAIIVRAILEAVAKKGAGQIPATILADLEAGLEQVHILGDLGIKLIGEAVKDPKSAVEKASKEAGKALEGILKKADEPAPAK